MSHQEASGPLSSGSGAVALRSLVDHAAKAASPALSLLSSGANLTERQRKEIGTSLRESTLVMRRASHLLGRTRAGRAPLERVRLNVADMVRAIAEKFDRLAGLEDIALRLDVPGTLTGEVDPLRFESVVLNLFVFSLRSAAPDSAVDVVLESSGTEARLRVSTKPVRAGIGPGRISEGHLANESFDDGAAIEEVVEGIRQHGGTVAGDVDRDGHLHVDIRFPLDAGLGLPVPERNGAYVIQTSPLLIQGAIEEITSSDVVRVAEPPELGEKPRVIVVEDEAAIREFLHSVLGNEFQVETVGDASEGLKRILEWRPDLILTDLSLPGMSGEEMIRRIRRNPELDRIPIVVISGNDDKGQRARLLGEGVQDYLEKPVSVPELRVRTRNQVIIKRTRDVLEEDLSVTSETLENLARKAAAQKRQAEMANRLRDEFVATLSHDLRTPLTSIYGWVRLLRTQEVTPSIQNEALSSIERNVRILTTNLEDLLDLSRIVTGKVELDIEVVEMGPLLANVTDSVRRVAGASDVTIETRFDPRAGTVLGDARRLTQIASHLIENAVKFSKQGGEVEVSLRPERGKVELRVSDDGEGILPEFLPHVFESFRQADASPASVRSGLGLGLAIVKALVELHGGTVDADSAGAGKGSTFTVRLPVFVEATTRYDPAPFRFPETSAQIEGLNVLLVEDDPDTLSFLTVLLEQSGVRVRAYADADALIDAFQRGPSPNLLLCDIGLPRKDGYELIREIREQESGSPVPAIALTAYTTPDDRERALSAGFQAHISKPVDPAALVDAIDRLARRDKASN